MFGFRCRQRLTKIIGAGALLLVAACASEGGIFDDASYDFIDRDLELNRDDYQNMVAPKESEYGQNPPEAFSSAPPIPEMAQILAAPKPPEVGREKLVTVSVTDDVPIKDVLLELARLADVDIELGPGIRGGISFSAKNRPFNEVIARIADLTGLRYEMHNGVLRIELDKPYLKNYSLDFLNIVRNSQSEVSVSTDVLSSASGGGSGGGSSGGGGEGLSTGSSSSISSTTESDFWDSVREHVSQILNSQPVEGMEPIEGENGGQFQAASSVPSAQPTQGGVPGSYFIINRQAGLLSASATQRQHEMLKHYLQHLKRNASAQVLIEAKIVEVELNQGYQSGVDWSSVIGNTDLNLNFPTTSTNGATVTVLGPGIDSDNVGAVNPEGDNNLGVNLDAVVQLTEQFGTSRTLSSPRLHAINNQQAVLTFAENRIFFEVDIEEEADQTLPDGTRTEGSRSVETTRRSVPIGIILSILPSINLDKNTVTLNVRPTLSRQVDTVQDPGSAILNQDLDADQQFVNEVPVVEVRELDSVMKLNSGSVMVIGGLMEDINQNTDEGVPYASAIPWIGNAFKSTNKQTTKRELIIFIKASIISPSGSYQPADKMIYDKFTDDPRPLVF